MVDRAHESGPTIVTGGPADPKKGDLPKRTNGTRTDAALLVPRRGGPRASVLVPPPVAVVVAVGPAVGVAAVAVTAVAVAAVAVTAIAVTAIAVASFAVAAGASPPAVAAGAGGAGSA